MGYREYLEILATLSGFGALVNTIARDCLRMAPYEEFRAKVGELHDLLLDVGETYYAERLRSTCAALRN
jgi:hypothetical protein